MFIAGYQLAAVDVVSLHQMDKKRERHGTVVHKTTHGTRLALFHFCLDLLDKFAGSGRIINQNIGITRDFNAITAIHLITGKYHVKVCLNNVFNEHQIVIASLTGQLDETGYFAVRQLHDVIIITVPPIFLLEPHGQIETVITQERDNFVICHRHRRQIGKYFFMEKTLKQKMEELGLDLLYEKIELPLVDVLFSMENDGLLIDQEELLRLKSSLEVELDEIVKKVIELAGENFNINSPKQLSAILFGKLGLKAKRNTKLSTNVEVLQQIEDQHEIVPQILRYRKIQKLLSTYVEAFCQFSKQNDGYIKTIFNQTLTSTGRLSSSEPNLQNLPIRDEEGRKLRKLFISRFPGGQMVSADYNQIELRLMAHYSQDSTMIEAYRRNEDIHARTASEIFGVPLSEVTPNERRLAKTVNFGIIYGISEYGLSVNLGTSVIRATEYMNKYFSRFPRVKEYMNESIAIARQNGYAKTLFGRIRYIPELSSSNGGIRKFGERVAINMPLQGTASDIIKLAMINVYKEIKNKNLKAKLVLQIHDELVVDCPKDEVSEVSKILSKEMEGVVSLSVPLPVEVSSGSSLYEC